MKSSLVNSVRLLGNVGNSPEVKTFEDGNKVARLSLATHEVYYNKKKEKTTITEWHALTFWGKKAELVENYVSKGDRLLVEGKLKYSSYTDKDGILRYRTEIEIAELQFLNYDSSKTTIANDTMSDASDSDQMPF